MNYETIIILGALIYVALAGYIAYCRSKKPAGATLAKAAVGVAPSAAPAEVRRPRLVVAGSHKPASSDRRFLKLFGLGRQLVLDMRYIPGPCTLASLAPNVAENLVKAYNMGDAVGHEVMEFIHHGRNLKDNQQLWFVLVSAGEEQPSRLVAFVDNVRSSPEPKQ